MAFDIHSWQYKQWKADKANTLNEAMYTYIGPKGENGPITVKAQVAQFIKKKGGNKKGYFLVAAKQLNKAKKVYQKYRGNFKNADFQDDMFDLMYENIVSEELLKEEYIELMRGLEEGLEEIVEGWIEWRKGPMTEKSDIAPARKELLKFCMAYLKKNIK
jgi:hypothetical protein